MHPILNDYNKLPVKQNPKLCHGGSLGMSWAQASSSHFVGPKPRGFPHSLACHTWLFVLFSIIHPFISPFEHGHSKLAQNILGAWILVKLSAVELWKKASQLQVLNYRELQVRAPNWICSMKGGSFHRRSWSSFIELPENYVNILSWSPVIKRDYTYDHDPRQCRVLEISN